MSGADLERILFILKENGSVEHVYSRIDSYLSRARESISNLKLSPTKIILNKLMDEAHSKWFWHSK
jgi:hypothetical protein